MKKCSLEFRKANLNDLDKITFLVTKLIGTCNINLKDKRNKTFEDIFKENKNSIEDDIEKYYVCENEGNLIGACGISDIKKGNNYELSSDIYREILYLVVDENFQKCGIGTKLMLLCIENNDTVPIIYEAWGDNGEYVNSKYLLEKLNFSMLKDLGNDYYKNNGYCSYCVNRDKECNTCLAQIWVKY